MYKPVIDKEKCIGCSSCGTVCPEVFALDAEGKAAVAAGEDFAKFQDKIKEAKDLCPVGAIILEEY